ncbi:HXXEE domain-containing protein [Propioniciclava soli]|uniref:HXXEE domain-containing protein n=1 Tax=Propioniciclava soli TaxID=2775081 RepID=A0ABZ3C565_9ACTN|nr:HXXEE domain-containing protein [Propioniciclava soli]
MGSFLARNNMYVVTAVAAGMGVYAALTWSTMPMVQRLCTLFLAAVVAHLWEEGRFPGGFSEMIARKLNFAAKSRSFGEIVTAALVTVLVIVPWFFPGVVFLQLAWVLLGILEVVAHLVAIRMFDLRRPYSPGLVTAAFAMFPVSIATILYVNGAGLVTGWDWLWAALVMLGGLLVAQRIVVVTSGMRYSVFLANVRGALLKG